MNATRTPVRELPPGTYCCSRCGREATYATRRPKPAMCRDCREVTEGVKGHGHRKYLAGCEDCKADRRAARQRAAAKAAS